MEKNPLVSIFFIKKFRFVRVNRIHVCVSGGSKPLVLTAEEFARLTARGVLKLHPSSSKASTASAASPTTATITSRALTSSRPLSVSGHTAVMTSRPVTRITGTISKPTSVTRVLPPTPGARGATMELTGSLPHISGDVSACLNHTVQIICTNK